MTDDKPWRLADLKFEPMGDDRRERATIDGVVIVRRDGRYSITAPEQEWSNIDEHEVDPALNFLFNFRAAGQMKNPAAPAVKREAEEEWGRR
jgi:hypothetical protein